MSAEQKCGTYAGYQAHRHAGEMPCDACRSAATEYQRGRRRKGGEPVERDLALNRARSAAVWRLKALHPDEFDLLVQDELRVEAARRRNGGQVDIEAAEVAGLRAGLAS